MKSPRLVCRLVALLGIGAGVLATPALAQDCPELVGRMPGGWIAAVAVSGDYAYLASYQGLVIADVSAPSAPRVVGDVGGLGGVAYDVALSGSHAYVAASLGGLRVVDVSDPAAPVEVGFVVTSGDARGVAVSGGYAYVADGASADDFSGLRVIDVSTPSEPVEVGFVDTQSAARSVAVSGSFAYVASEWWDGSTWRGGLRVIDVSTPSEPVEVGFVDTDTPGPAQSVAVSGSYAYVAAGWGLEVIDVSNPSAPVEVGFADTPGEAEGVAVSGDYAYVADYTSLRVIDVSAPAAPVEVGFVDTPGSAIGVAVSGNYAYVVGRGFSVINVSTPSAPVEVGSVDTLAYAHGVAVSGGYAYVVGGLGVHGGNGLSVIDARTPFAPAMVGYVSTDFPSDVEVSGGYAYVASLDPSGLHVIDVSTPSTPVEVGFFGTPGGAWDVAVSEGYAYVADGVSGLRVIDVSTPSTPVEVGFFAGGALDVAVSEGYAYVVNRVCLWVIDVSTPSAPAEVGRLSGGGGSDVTVSDGYAYVVAGGSLKVIDVSMPSAPMEVGSVDTPGYAHDVAVSEEFLYVTVGEWPEWSSPQEGDRSLRVIDVSTPSAPVEAGYHDTLPSYEWDLGRVAVSDGHVFFVSGGAGLYVFNECAPLADASECFIPAAAVAAGAQGAFFQTDVEINNTGMDEAQLTFQWLPRGEDNSEPVESEPIALAPGQSLRYENVLTELFGLGPDSLGALKMVAGTESVIGMSRTYNVPGSKAAGTFGQGLPAIRATEMIKRTERRRIIFLSGDFSSRANVGCVNGSSEPVTINVELFNSHGESLEVKTMELGPWSNDQINRVFQGHLMGNGYVDVWADSNEALYYCYGSVLDNLTSDPTTILPQVPSDDTTFIPAAALAAGLEGAFFRTDVDLNNVGSTDLTYQLLWLPRGADNTDAVHSDTFSLSPGAGVRYANVLDEVFGLEPDQVGALAVEASGIDLLSMSRTYNLPSAKVAGTFGQELPGIPADRMIPTGVKKRIIFMSENDDVRANVGCVNGVGTEVAVQIELYNSDGVKLETKYMMLPPYSNRQINGIFQDYAPVNGYVDVRAYTPDASIYCYGSVLDNLTSDPTTVLPQ